MQDGEVEMIFVISAAPLFVLQDFDGVHHSLENALEKGVVVLDFWASWCTPCKKAMPFLDSLAVRYKKSNLTVFGICVDTKRSIGAARAFWRRQGFSYIPLWDWKGEVSEKYGVKYLPTLFILNGKREIVYQVKGYSKRIERELEDTLRKIILRDMLDRRKEEKCED